MEKTLTKEETSVMIKTEDKKRSNIQIKNRGNLIFYADSSEVNPIDSKDDYDYVNISPVDQKKQSMRGFNEEYNNIVDYIVKITRQIWKEKDIGLIYDTYSTGVSIHKGLINSHGINEVISGTLQTLHSFPDRKGLGWSVVWSGNDQDGFFTSHRGRSVATNTGDSYYGPATGKKVMFRTTADCLIHSNKIYEEWLVMDTYHLVQQLGFDPIEVAKKVAKGTQKLAPSLSFGLPETAETGLPPKHFIPSSDEFEIGEFMLDLFNKVWERRSFNFVKKFYEDKAVVHYVCNRDLVGVNEIQGMFISLFASVPNAKLVLERITCNRRENDQDWDVAVRWRLQGMHEGTGYFGVPSGKPIDIFGISHYKVRNERIVEEWLLFDGMEVLRQIYLPESEEKASSENSQTEDGNFTGVS
ncbi:ester cyclase [Bacillus sp. ISL-40]|uniref:ester cyclase n=1 Tax=unclassified Bacillus (in: firmicutes) TaxID=185979 RepID=UPI001BEC2445|nr:MULTISPECIES: ester cyclase [unclassified Bacillus (in: firmicutes)]MBT2698544.1 ester cyclase [Bacillus sp. ISL-40]MBT2720177.1 ester cyclase [Bacillus sp. ISL-46]MBT2739230.1 ester cyclase [Bacillus sp. ISL-77]